MIQVTLIIMCYWQILPESHFFAFARSFVMLIKNCFFLLFSFMSRDVFFFLATYLFSVHVNCTAYTEEKSKFLKMVVHRWCTAAKSHIHK